MHAFEITKMWDSTMVLFLLLLFPISLFFLVVHGRKYIDSKCTQLPPGPSAWYIAGNIFFMMRKPHVFFSNLAQIHGQLFSLRVGRQLIVVASSPVSAMEVLKTHDRQLVGRHVPGVASRVPELVESTFSYSQYDDKWRFLRSVCHTELFSAKAVESQAKLREEKAKRMVEYLGRREGEVVNIENLVYVTLINILGNLFVSRDLVDLECEVESGEMQQLVRTLIETAGSPGLADLHPALDGLDVWSKHKAMDSRRKGKSLWEDIIKERRDRIRRLISGGVSSTGDDFLDVLIETSKFCDDKIIYLLTELLSAGSFSSLYTIEWTIAELLRNEESMCNLRKELAEAVDGDVVKESHLSHLPYFQACVKETLRLHHASSLPTPRRALETFTLMNYTIPKDSLVYVNSWAISRDPLIWNDPTSFKPERFIDSNKDFRGGHFEFIPFSAGRRICLGLPMAIKQIQLLVASLVHNFDWSLPNGMNPTDLDMKEKFGLMTHMEKPLLLIPKTRKQPAG